MAGLFAQVRYILFDWGRTLSSVEREEQTWRGSLAALISAGRKQGLPLGDGHIDSLITVFLTTRAEADADPEHKEIELIPVLSNWLGQQGITNASAEALQHMERAYWRSWVGCLGVIDGVSETLGALRRRGYRLGLVSNVTTPPHWCRLELERLGLWKLLDCTTFSSEVRVRKPHPRIYEDALGKLGQGRPVPTGRVLFVGDSPRYDVAAPADLGMRTVLVRGEAHRWPDSDHEGITPDLTVDCLTELLPHLPGPA